jgi:Zn-dependent peptidase ImmA (M78 family)/DNA-binding XRE family transcriptional regulator
MTKKALADAVGVSVRSITEYEAGRQNPAPQTVKALSDALGFPEAFFGAPDLDEFPFDAASFRALSTMSSRQRNQATAAGELAFQLSDWIDRDFQLPGIDVPKLTNIEPEAAADFVRRQWGLGQKSIQNLVHLLEAHGVRVFSLAEECRDVDAFSCWRPTNGTPYVFLNTMKTAEHSRMDAAHELGHLVLHWRHETPRGREVELEANAFASAFLMPRESVFASAPHDSTLAQIDRAKALWGVSSLALVYRMHKLGLLTDWNYRSLCIAISKRGRAVEVNGMERETSQVLAKVMSQLREEGVTRAVIARELMMPVQELDKLVFGLVLTGVSGQGEESSDQNRPQLRVVK